MAPKPKKGKTADASKPETNGKAPSTPSQPRPWPPLPSGSLPREVVTILDAQIITIPSFFTSKECSSLISFAEANLTFAAPKPPTKDEAARTNYRWSGDGPEEVKLMDVVWARLRPLLVEYGVEGEREGDVPVGLHSNVRMYRYASSEHFRPHYDDSLVDPRTGLRSGWTLLMYLTGAEDGLEGGQTVFYPEKRQTANDEPVVVELERGTALLHRHGRNCMLHEAKPVLKGVKWVLRSDLLFSRPPSAR